MICGNCGSANPDGTLFCVACGQQLVPNPDGTIPPLLNTRVATNANNNGEWSEQNPAPGWNPPITYDFKEPDKKTAFVLAIVGVALSTVFLYVPGLVLCIVALALNHSEKAKGINSSYHQKTLVVGITGIVINVAFCLILGIGLIGSIIDDANSSNTPENPPATAQTNPPSSTATSPNNPGSGSSSGGQDATFANMEEIPGNPCVIANDNISFIQATAKATDARGYSGYVLQITNKSTKGVLYVSNSGFKVNGLSKNVILSQYVEPGETTSAFIWIDPNDYSGGLEDLASMRGTIDAISGSDFKAVATYSVSLGQSE